MNLTYSKVDIPLQLLCKISNTNSLNKVVDTPLRETLSDSSICEEDKDKIFPNWMIDINEEMNISQESTSEDGGQIQNVHETRKMSIKTSDVFSQCKKTDYKHFLQSQYQSVKNQRGKNFNFRVKPKTQNFTSRKTKTERWCEGQAELQKTLFETFEDDPGCYFSENDGRNVEEQPSISNSRYTLKNNKSKVKILIIFRYC